MRRNIEQIEIKEPPIEELKKKSSCLKRSCFSGCGCLFVFIIGSLLLLKYAAGPQPKELKKIPENFPKSIPIYDKDNIENIIFTSGEEKGRAKEAALFIPKLVLSPILLAFDEENIGDKKFTWQKFFNLMKEPSTDLRDTVEINWKDLPAEPKFILGYYKNEFEKENYEINEITKTDKNIEFSFEKEKIYGVFYLEDNPEQKGTDSFSLTIKIPH